MSGKKSEWIKIMLHVVLVNRIFCKMAATCESACCVLMEPSWGRAGLKKKHQLQPHKSQHRIRWPIRLYHNMQEIDNTVIIPQSKGFNHQHGWLMNSNENNSFAAETRTEWGNGYHPLMVFTASLSHSMWSLPLIDELRWVLQGVIHKLSEVPKGKVMVTLNLP